MKVFILEYTGFYSITICIVIAKTIERAKAIAEESGEIKIHGNEKLQDKLTSHNIISTREKKERFVEAYGYSE